MAKVDGLDGLCNIQDRHILCLTQALDFYAKNNLASLAISKNWSKSDMLQAVAQPLHNISNEFKRSFVFSIPTQKAKTKKGKDASPAIATYTVTMGLSLDEKKDFVLTKIGQCILNRDLSIPSYALILLSKVGVYNANNERVTNLLTQFCKYAKDNLKASYTKDDIKLKVLSGIGRDANFDSRDDIAFNAFLMAGILSVSNDEKYIVHSDDYNLISFIATNGDNITPPNEEDESYMGDIDKGIVELISENSQGLFCPKYNDLINIKLWKFNTSLYKHNNISYRHLQRIFYGAPGTGKSNTIKKEVEDKGRAHFRTTFHPDSDYSTFVGCYKPTMVEVPVRDGSGHEVANAKQEEKNRISYSFVPQSFSKAYCEAWNKYDGSENAEPVFLIIEEINRGSCAQIFGDVFQLLDREIDGERCGFSTYPIDADEDLKDFLERGVRKDGTQWLTNKDGIKDGKLCLPPNLCIWATMNTSDQSLFPMDSAFKRRWEWKYVPVNHKDAQKFHIAIGEKRYNWDQFIVAVNKKVFEATQSADKQLGNRFCRADKILNPDANADCHEFEISINQLIGKVMFYLWEEVCKDAPEDEQINFMRIKLDSTTSEYFTFQDLYDGKTTSKNKVLNQEELLQAFMDYLGVEEEKDEQSENPGMNTAQPVDNGQGELPAEGVDSIEVENISSSGE